MRFVALYLTLIVINISCKPKRVDRTVETSKVKAVSTINKWLWGYKTDFLVCWESPVDPNYPEVNEVKTDIMEHVVKEFSKTPIRWLGWEHCEKVDASGSEPDIRMFIYDNPAIEKSPELQETKKTIFDGLKGIFKEYPGHPAAYVGIRAKNRFGGFQVSLYGTQAAPEYVKLYNSLTDTGKRNLIVSVALHEFGHVLGLVHEDRHLVRELNTAEGFLARKASENHSELHDHAINCKELGYEEKSEYRRWEKKRQNNPESYGGFSGDYNPTGFLNRCYYWVSHNYDEKKLEINDLDAKGIREFLEYQKSLSR